MTSGSVGIPLPSYDLINFKYDSNEETNDSKAPKITLDP